MMVIGGQFFPHLQGQRPAPTPLPETQGFDLLSSRVYSGRNVTWFTDADVGGGGECGEGCSVCVGAG